jgi:hypothetical protein
MPPRRYELYVARIRFRRSEDLRPWVVIDDPVQDPRERGALLVTLAPVSSQLDMLLPNHFLMDASAPDFPTTGLRRSSYVVGDPIRVRVERLERRIGELTGTMLALFREWSGD